MHDLHMPDKEELAQPLEAGQYSSGMLTLSKCLKTAFALMVAVIGCMILWFFTFGGFFKVEPQESVIVLHFGEFAGLYNESAHWVMPYPVNTIIRVPRSSQSIKVSDFMPADRSFLLGKMEMPVNPDAPLVPGKDGYLITGDANIIHTEWEIVYKVSDPKTYYEKCLTPFNPAEDDEIWTDPKARLQLGPRGPQTMLRNALSNTVIKITSTWSAEDLLYRKSYDYVQDVKAAFIKKVNDMDIGVAVDSVTLRAKTPPPQTIAAFEDVISSEQQGASELEKAKAYAIEQLNSSDSERARLLAEAETYKKRTVADVVASEITFGKILKEYKRSPDSVMVALYTSALSDALSKAKDKFIIRRNGTSSQELRLKLNPEPPEPPKKDEAKKDSKQ